MEYASGVYNPNDDASLKPRGDIKKIIDTALAAKRRRKGLRQSYHNRRAQNPVEMAAIRRATNRMVGSE